MKMDIFNKNKLCQHSQICIISMLANIKKIVKRGKIIDLEV